MQIRKLILIDFLLVKTDYIKKSNHKINIMFSEKIQAMNKIHTFCTYLQ